jgi:hypothetical protein
MSVLIIFAQCEVGVGTKTIKRNHQACMMHNETDSPSLKNTERKKCMQRERERQKNRVGIS